MSALLTIDTLISLTTKHILHPFIFLLLALTYAASTYSTPSTLFTPNANPTIFNITLPNFPLSCIGIALILTTFRILVSLDARYAAGSKRRLNWEDEVVLITGGLGGLGGLLAEVYGMRGVPVAILDIKDVGAKEKEELSEKGISYWQCDVGDRGQVEKTLGAVQKELGPPTILINNAAIIAGSPFLTLSPTSLERIYRTNVLSHYHTTQLLFPTMLSRPTGGTIVTISSVLGYTGCAGLSAYTSTKAALTALHRSLSAELSILATERNVASAPRAPQYPAQIRTLLITPGQLSTPLFSSVAPPSTFFGPTVQVHELAAEIVRKIDAGEGGEISMPLYARWIGVLGVLPEGVGRLARGWAGLDGAGWAAFGDVREGKGGGLSGEK